jgi:hypothetical protein
MDAGLAVVQTPSPPVGFHRQERVADALFGLASRKPQRTARPARIGEPALLVEREGSAVAPLLRQPFLCRPGCGADIPDLEVHLALDGDELFQERLAQNRDGRICAAPIRSRPHRR